MKFKKLLNYYGRKKRSVSFIDYIEKCMTFYHIEATLAHGGYCDLKKVHPEDMITFRLSDLK